MLKWSKQHLTQCPDEVFVTYDIYLELIFTGMNL